MRHIAIVGGGIAGLAAAYHLENLIQKGLKGVAYTLYEGDQRLGGKILTERVNGYLIEGGPDCFLSEKPQVFTLSSQLGLDNHLLGTNEDHKGTYVLSGGRLHRLPEGLVLMVPSKITPFLMSGLVSWPGKLRMLMDLFIPPRRGGDDESLASFVTRRLGREALEKIAEPLVAGIHAGDPETMSLRASFPRFLEMEARHGSLIRAMLAARKRQGTAQQGQGHRQGSSNRTYFMTFKGGLGELVDAITSRLKNGRILTRAVVTKLLRLENGSEKDPSERRFALEVAGTKAERADAVILAIPAHSAAPLIRGISPQLAALLEGIRFTSTATVSLAYRQEDLPRPPQGFGFVIPAVEKRRIMAVTYSSVKFNHRAPKGHILLRVFVGGPHNQGLVEGDEDLASIAREEIHQILGITASPVLARSYRWIKGMPQYTLGHLERIACIEENLRDIPGLFLAGGSYRGIGISDCIKSGITAAENAVEMLRR